MTALEFGTLAAVIKDSSHAIRQAIYATSGKRVQGPRGSKPSDFFPWLKEQYKGGKRKAMDDKQFMSSLSTFASKAVKVKAACPKSAIDVKVN